MNIGLELVVANHYKYYLSTASILLSLQLKAKVSNNGVKTGRLYYNGGARLRGSGCF